MKKKIAVALLLSLCVVMLFAVAAFAAQNPPLHDCNTDGHEATGEWIVTEKPTCTETGLQVQYCKYCGKAYTCKHEIIPATGHTMVRWTDMENANCMTPGTIAMKCSVCGWVDPTTIQTGVVTEGHDWDEGTVVVAPTCAKPGRMLYLCKRNPQHQRSENIPATGNHTYKWVIDKEPTCTEKGLKHEECTVCGATKPAVDIPANGHTKIGEVKHLVLPTCTEWGKDEYVCAVCHITLTEDIKPLGHDWKGAVEEEPTCAAEGREHFYCVRVVNGVACKETYDRPIPKTAEHTKLHERIIREATPDQVGIKHEWCDVCGYAADVVFPYASVQPSTAPSTEPTTAPSTEPTTAPSTAPSTAPTTAPTTKPTKAPSGNNGHTSSTGGGDAAQPATGDNSNNVAYVVAIVAMLGLAVAAFSRKKVNG